jgi:polyhydroxyalkanoate synthesis regulator protein
MCVQQGTKLMPRIVKFHRHRYTQRAVLFDDELELRSIEELRDWAVRGVDFVVIDTETNEDVTRVLLA